MRVVHLVRTFLYPTETFIYSQLAHLPPERAAVLTRDVQNQDRFPSVTPRAFCLELETWRKRWSDINYRWLRRMTGYERQYYFRELPDLAPDLFHAHYAVDAAYFQDVWRQLNRPLVVSCYGYDVSSFPNRYLGRGRDYLEPVWRNARLVLAMTNDMRDDLLRLGCPEEKIRVHYHGINLTRFRYVERNLSAPVIRILFVGSLTHRKGVEDVLRAFAQIAKQHPQVELRFAGRGFLHSTLEPQARAWGLEDRVSFAGFVRHEELQEELHQAHIFCHPSRTLRNGEKEGIPGTIVEAMATGLPVVTTRHAGIPEMVRDGADGFLVAERDVPAIAQAFLTLIHNPALRIQMGRNAAMQAQQNADVVRLTQELSCIYEEIVAATK